MSGNSGTTAGVAGVTRLVVRGGGPRRNRPGAAFRASVDAYIDEAERLLERSRAEDAPSERVVWAYRAALRGAGAAIEAGATGRRRRPAGSAWTRLRAVVPEDGLWADRFEVHARLVSRVEAGLGHGTDDATADRIYGEVCRFVDHVRDRVGYLPEVA